MKPIALAIFDIDGVVRDVGGSYRRAIADTVEYFTLGSWRPSLADIDQLKAEGTWNNDWKASQELIYRYANRYGQPIDPNLSYEQIVDFFQKRYRGPDPDDPAQWTGYITQEPLLLSSAYLQSLSQSGMPWGFFSGATRGSAEYVLKNRLGLTDPVLVAMEDAPSKPDPTGLISTVRQIEQRHPEALGQPVIYAGDTVGDLQTVAAAAVKFPSRQWIGVGILPPHAQADADYQAAYAQKLRDAGAAIVIPQVQDLTPERIRSLLG